MRLPNPISNELYKPLNYAIEGLLNEPPINDRVINEFVKLARMYAKRGEVYGKRVVNRFNIYILVGSKYSALASAEKSRYNKADEVADVIERTAEAIRDNDRSKFGSLRAEAKALFDEAWLKEASRVAAMAAKVAYVAIEMELGDIDDARWRRSLTLSQLAAEASAQAGEAREAWAQAAAGKWAGTAKGAEMMERAATAAREAANSDYAKALIKIMKKESERAPAQNPSAPARKPSDAKSMIAECRRLWEHYCERPGKKRLAAVMKHLEKMKGSKAASVKTERTKCLRAAKLEEKKY